MTTHRGPPASVRIRPAEHADLLSVMRIERASFPQPWPYDAFQRYLGDDGFLVAVDREDGIDAADGGPAVDSPVVGYVVVDTVRNYGRPLGHVKNLAVYPDHRGRGIGSALLDRGLSVLADAHTVKLEVRASNDSARSLYRRFGFEPLRREPRYYEDGEDAVVMVRDGE